MDMYEKAIKRKVIRKWIKKVWKGKYYKTLSHLHFDEIGKIFKKRSFIWIDAADEIFEITEEIRKELKISLYLVLIFTLKSKKKKTGINFKSEKSLYKELDWTTPPALYLFKKGQIKWEKKPNIPIHWIPFKFRDRNVKPYYGEGKEKYSGEYIRDYCLLKIK
jgi:hypothetical protein